MLQFIILYVLRRYGLDIEKIIRDNPFILKNKKSEDIKTEEDIDKLLNDVSPGLILKYQLGLENLKYVYIRRMLRSAIHYYEVVFDTHLQRSISQATLRNTTFYKSYVYKNNNLERRIFTPPIQIERFQGNIPASAMVIKLDLAGKYFTQLTEGVKTYKKCDDCEKLEEISIDDFQKNGFSDLNLKWYKDRQQNGNTKLEYWKTTYNKKTGNLLVLYHATPTYLNIPNPHDNNKVVTSVKIISKTGEERSAKYYTFWIQFQDIKSLIGNKDEWLKLSKMDKISIVRDIIKSNDVKLFDNTMAFKWQGTWKTLSDLDSTIHPFPNLPDKDIWNGERHKGIHLDKHYKGIFETLPFNADKIAQAITDEFEKREEI